MILCGRINEKNLDCNFDLIQRKDFENNLEMVESMRKLEHIRKFEIPHPILKRTGEEGEGVFIIPYDNHILHVIASSDGGWEHVSVSHRYRNPNWEEMCFIKNLFFDENETVIQFHPKKSEYVDIHKTCLHLWRSTDFEHVLPPKKFV